MNGLRTRLTLDHKHRLAENPIPQPEPQVRTHQQALNESVHTGDRIVGWVGCIGLSVFIINELIGRYL